MNGRPSPIAHACPIERDELQRVLEVGGADVLAARGDDELLLAVDDLEVAVLVDRADVARVQPAVDDRFVGLVGLLVVPLEDVAAAADDLAVVGDHDLAAGDRLADRARP